MISMLVIIQMYGRPAVESFVYGFLFFTGIWICNVLGVVWIVATIRRVKAVSNADARDSPRLLR